MDRTKWYLSTSFICVLFSFWVLVIPLILGIIFLSKQKKATLGIHKYFLNKEKELKEKTDFIEVRETEQREKMKTFKNKEELFHTLVIKKQKELATLSIKQQLNIIKLQKEKIQEYESIVEQRELQLFAKQKEVSALALAQLLRVIAMVRSKQNELGNLEVSILERKQRVKEVFKKKHQKIENLKSHIQVLKKNLMDLEDEALYKTFGFYERKFQFESSEEYSNSLEQVRQKQKKLVKQNLATNHLDYWKLDGSYKKGAIMNKLNINLAVKSFNHECDYIISKVKFNNVDLAKRRIQTEFKRINKLNRYNKIEITEEYLNLKLQELYLAYEFLEKKQEELEEQRRIRELLREAKRAQEELEEELKKIKKEEQHLLNVLAQHLNQISEQEKIRYTERLNEIRAQIADVDYRINNQKAGYVYIISNIGCFGENVYKIGMTRRLDPMDRVRELGGASVPFHFDVHAVIFSEDAPALEASLHRAFHHRRVNRVNQRKEFFKVNLTDIKKVVFQSHEKPVHFKIIAEAKEFRESLKLDEQYVI